MNAASWIEPLVAAGLGSPATALWSPVAPHLAGAAHPSDAHQDGGPRLRDAPGFDPQTCVPMDLDGGNEAQPECMAGETEEFEFSFDRGSP